MNANLLTFRESFRGYNKDDVNTYIADQNEKFADMEADYKKEITDLRTEYNHLQSVDTQLTDHIEKLNEANETIASLENKLAVAREHEAAMAEELEKYRQQLSLTEAKKQDGAAEMIAHLQNKLAESESIIAALTEANQELKEQNHALNESTVLSDKAEISDKAQLYDQISQQIGSLILDAKSNADETVKRAQTTAAEILSRASAEADETHRLADEYAAHVRMCANERLQQACNAINDTLRKLTGDCVADYSQRLSHCKASIDAIINEFRSTTEQANLRMESLLTTRSNELSSMLDSVTELPN